MDKRTKYTIEFKNEIVTLYKNKWHCNKIGAKYRIHRRTIKRLLNEMGIKLTCSSIWHKKYTTNESFFEIIDNKEKAYLLGWVLSDGSVNDSRNCFTIKLQIRDKEILELFNKLLESNRPIVIQKSKNPNWQDVCYCCFSSKKIVSDLRKFGCVQNKSLSLPFPQNIPDEFLFHFIRGYFDGDGCISLYKNKYPMCSIICSKKFAIKLQNIFKKLDIESTLQKSKKIYSVHFGKVLSIDKFLKCIYKDSEGLRLSRKYNKMLQLYEVRKLMSKRSIPLCQ